MTNIIAVTSCATGIAHSYMAAETIKKTAKKNGWKARVEIQGALGVENRLSESDIEDSDVIVLANDVRLTDGDRFEGYKQKTISMTPHSIIQGPDVLVENIRKRLTQDGD